MNLILDYYAKLKERQPSYKYSQFSHNIDGILQVLG